MTARPLTIAQARVLAVVSTAEPRDAQWLRVAIDLPDTHAAQDTVTAALADLVDLGLVTRTTGRAGSVTYTRADAQH